MNANSQLTTHNCIILGGGHNGLVAACYLAKAGKSVLLLEKNNYLGGAATSQQVFPDYEARLSRYAYLVSLFPEQILQELGINLELRQRRIASFTPYVKDGKYAGLLISNEDEALTKANILALGYGEKEWEGYQALLCKQSQFAEMVWDSILQPLKSKIEWKQLFEAKGLGELWQEMVEEPLGKLIEKHLKSDILRGVVLTDGKIGAYTHAHDESLLQNRTYLYHIIGNKTGEWRVPTGGMGNLSEQLEQTARSLGVQTLTNAHITEVSAEKNQVAFIQEGQTYTVIAEHIFSNLAPQVLNDLTSKPNENSVIESSNHSTLNEGTAFKINMLLRKLPQLKCGTKPEDAFAGTFHIDENYSDLARTFEECSAGKVPAKIAGEIYCHTLTDNSILSPELREKGYQTLTFFGLDLPYELFLADNEATKKQVVEGFFKGINQYLLEPIQNCLALDKNGNYCLEAKSALDLEQEVGLPRGNIFHNALSWFYAETPIQEGTWGVETAYPNISICGSGAMRGGAVSGITGRNAAIAYLGN